MSIELLEISSAVACRSGCGACCIAPSISSAIPGMPHGKPAGIRCVQLSDLNQCLIFGLPSRPKVCASLMPTLEMCGVVHADAFGYLEALERATA
jgi:Fe-S-cluster containining protein